MARGRTTYYDTVGFPGAVDPFYLLVMASPFVAVAGPLVAIGTLSHFSNGESTLSQRVWSMLWLGFGSLLGPMFSLALETAIEPRNPVLGGLAQLPLEVSIVGFPLVYGVPAIGGLVVVGQMIMQFGACFEI